MPKYMSERMPARIAENILNRMPDKISKFIAITISEYISEK